jgi:hypothetical protein
MIGVVNLLTARISKLYNVPTTSHMIRSSISNANTEKELDARAKRQLETCHRSLTQTSSLPSGRPLANSREASMAAG